MDAQRPETAAEAWRELSRRYVQDVSRYFRERTVGEVARFLFQGGGRYGNCPLHDQFLAQAQEQVDLFVSGNPAASEAGTLLEAILLGPRPGADHPAGLCLIAAEGLALPLIPLAETGVLTDVADRYNRQFSRRTPALPIQDRLCRAMREELARRGAKTTQ